MIRIAGLFAALALAVVGALVVLGPDRIVEAVIAEAPADKAEPSSSSARRVIFNADRSGHFMLDASINGRKVGFMVDTGATSVALNEETALRLGIRPNKKDYSVPVRTANGVVLVARVVLKEIAIGRIVVRNVEATVIPGKALGVNLLGMSFLKKLRSFEMAGGQLVMLN